MRRRVPFRRPSAEALLLALAFFAYLGMARWFSTDVPGGADWWGYVSEAVRLSHGHFYEPERVLSPFGLPEDADLTQPLGYTSKGQGGTVPIYPFGYPLLMALAITLVGHQAAFWVTPVLAAGAVLLTYLIGRACLGRPAGVIAALLLAVFPNFLWGAFQPLSDVPAAFLCALALVALLALPVDTVADVLLGASLGFGVWVRPNMVLLVAVVGGWLVLRREWRRLLRMAAALAPFLVVEALLNWHLFGAPWRTGYGEIVFGGSLAETLARGLRHLLRLNVQQAGVGLALLALGLFWNRLAVSRRVLLVGVLAVFLCFFAAYRVDDAWWYFRFLLPAMPAVVVVEAGFLVHVAGPGRRRRLRAAAVAVVVCALVLGESRYGVAKGIYTLKEGEKRYPQAAELAASLVRPPAVVLAMQHSGSLRYYAGLPTARYDMRPPESLAATLVKVSQAGGRVYLVADDWELEQIANRGRGFLLAGATLLGHVTPGFTAVFLLDPGQAAERLRRGASVRRSAAEVAVFEGGWERSGSEWRVRGTGLIRLPANADPALARVCASESTLVVRRPGFAAAQIGTGACTDVPLLPGPSGQLEIAAVREDSAALPAIELLAVGALRFQNLLSTAYMLPQVARLAGQAGSFWQTDLLLVNPQPHPLRVTGLFLRTGRDNRQAYAATTVVPAGAVVTLRDVLRAPEFEWLGGRGALLVVAGDAGTPCSNAGCRFLVCARTYNALAPGASPDAGEWLPGLPAETAMAGGRASFSRLAGGEGTRASVGLASWSDHPLRVRVRFGPESGPTGVVREAVVPAFGHVRIDLGAWSVEGHVEVELLGPAGVARLFPYVSVVDGATSTARHLLPDAISIRTPTGPRPMPRTLSSELKREI